MKFFYDTNHVFNDQDLHRAITRLGLNPTDQEIVDISNYIAKLVQNQTLIFKIISMKAFFLWTSDFGV